jgi:hypothetical protein
MAPSCKSISSVQLTSSVIVGDFVYEVDCMDNDVGPNGDLTYSKNGSEWSFYGQMFYLL